MNLSAICHWWPLFPYEQSGLGSNRLGNRHRPPWPRFVPSEVLEIDFEGTARLLIRRVNARSGWKADIRTAVRPVRCSITLSISTAEAFARLNAASGGVSGRGGGRNYLIHKR